MILTSDNLVVVAAQNYVNHKCLSTEEFLEDLNKHILIKRLARKISKKNSKNIRLLTNHIIGFTNNFNIEFSKIVLLFECDEKQLRVIKSILLYLGFLQKNEYNSEELDLETIILLKEMDR